MNRTKWLVRQARCFNVKVAMKGLGIGKKHLRYIVDLFPDIPSVPDSRSLHGEWTYNSHTKVISDI